VTQSKKSPNQTGKERRSEYFARKKEKGRTGHLTIGNGGKVWLWVKKSIGKELAPSRIFRGEVSVGLGTRKTSKPHRGPSESLPPRGLTKAPGLSRRLPSGENPRKEGTGGGVANGGGGRSYKSHSNLLEVLKKKFLLTVSRVYIVQKSVGDRDQNAVDFGGKADRPEGKLMSSW